MPGGKIEKAESPKDAVIREIREEVGLNIDNEQLEMVGLIYCRMPDIDYVFHIFRRCFSELPEVDLSLDEHIDLKWVTAEEALELPLIAGGVEALDYYQKKCPD